MFASGRTSRERGKADSEAEPMANFIINSVAGLISLPFTADAPPFSYSLRPSVSPSRICCELIQFVTPASHFAIFGRIRNINATAHSGTNSIDMR